MVTRRTMAAAAASIFIASASVQAASASKDDVTMDLKKCSASINDPAHDLYDAIDARLGRPGEGPGPLTKYWMSNNTDFVYVTGFKMLIELRTLINARRLECPYRLSQSLNLLERKFTRGGAKADPAALEKLRAAREKSRELDAKLKHVVSAIDKKANDTSVMMRKQATKAGARSAMYYFLSPKEDLPAKDGCMKLPEMLAGLPPHKGCPEPQYEGLYNLYIAEYGPALKDLIAVLDQADYAASTKSLKSSNKAAAKAATTAADAARKLR